MSKTLLLAVIFGCIVTAGCASTNTVSRGNQLMQNGRYSEAITTYEKVLKDSTDYYGLLNKGIAEWRIKEYETALHSFTEAIKAKPDNSSLAYYYRAEVYFMRHNYKEAFKNVNKAIKQDSLNVYALNLRGRINTIEGRYSEAINDFSTAVEIDGESNVSGYIYHNRAIVYIAREDYESAIHDYENYIRFLKKHSLPVTSEDNYLLEVLRYATGNSENTPLISGKISLEDREKNNTNF